MLAPRNREYDLLADDANDHHAYSRYDPCALPLHAHSFLYEHECEFYDAHDDDLHAHALHAHDENLLSHEYAYRQPRAQLMQKKAKQK